MLQFEIKEDQSAKIIVIGVGGGGCNAVNRMIDDGLQGITYLAINTDKQALAASKAESTLQIGEKLTKGRGRRKSGRTKVGRRGMDEIAVHQRVRDGIRYGRHGRRHRVAQHPSSQNCKDMGILTVGVVTKPFSFEGRKGGPGCESM
jgi:cell division protein FtsZ